MYQYSAEIIKITDGDTFVMDIDLGMSVWLRNQTIRLYGIDTPEVFGIKKGSQEWQKGMEASDFVKKHIKTGEKVIIQTHKDEKGKYGRLLGEIFVNSELFESDNISSKIRKINSNYVCINDILVEKGFAVEKTY